MFIETHIIEIKNLLICDSQSLRVTVDQLLKTLSLLSALLMPFKKTRLPLTKPCCIVCPGKSSIFDSNFAVVDLMLCNLIRLL